MELVFETPSIIDVENNRKVRTVSTTRVSNTKSSTITVPHMLFEHLKWIKQQPPSHPMLPVELSVATDGYKEVGAIVPPATRRRTADIRALADTGCQACCIGERQLNMRKVSYLAKWRTWTWMV